MNGGAATEQYKTESPPLVERWRYNEPDEDAFGNDIPELYGKFENGWRFEIKPIDGHTYYNLHVPLDELDEWESGGQIEEWSFVGFERIVTDLWDTLHEIDSLAEMKEKGDSPLTHEYGMLFEMLERENR